MKRLPRKYKKQVKKIVATKMAMKITMASMTSAIGMVQMAKIVSQPVPGFHLGITEKTIAATRVAMDSAQAISKIMSEPPNSWREFIR